MESFRLVISVPDITWGRIAQMCERAMNPMYKGLYSILERDMEHVAEIFAALELDAEPVSVTIKDMCASRARLLSFAFRLRTVSPRSRGMCFLMNRALQVPVELCR